MSHVFNREKKWKTGEVIDIYFADGDDVLQKSVATIAKQWTDYANLTFKFHYGKLRTSDTPDILITFNGNGNSSYIGTDSRDIARYHNPSMILGELSKSSITYKRKKRVVLHEFGHAIGLIHEHLNYSTPIKWDTKAVLKDCKKSDNWDETTCNRNILDTRDYEHSCNSSLFDDYSIMLYCFDSKLMLQGESTRNNTNLSITDKLGIIQVYPGKLKIDMPYKTAYLWTKPDGKHYTGKWDVKLGYSTSGRKWAKKVQTSEVFYKKIERINSINLTFKMEKASTEVLTNIALRSLEDEGAYIEIIVNGEIDSRHFLSSNKDTEIHKYLTNLRVQDKNKITIKSVNSKKTFAFIEMKTSFFRLKFK
ncbi:hypothetical protein A9Q86_09760 [Flavobacteriales bacterium 33_180_T64]|nr:hypothetical protein A9Q86_09760 [Flavobacteriales bacterium 33_180_T64]